MQYVNLTSTYSKITYKEGFANKTDTYQLIVELMIKVNFTSNLYEHIGVQEVFLFKNDGEDVKEFNFSLKEIQDFIIANQ